VFVGGEPFGLPVDCVQTIFQMETVTPAPLGPREIVGLVNLRGKTVTAVSVRRRLHMPDAPEMKSRLAIGMEHRGENFALIVDEVGDVIFLRPETQIALPPHLDEHRAKLTEAVYRLDKGILSMLDVGSVFDFQRRV
jgi:purine-binding chemotaxis protein CheW